jgi:hypothetical protein
MGVYKRCGLLATPTPHLCYRALNLECLTPSSSLA